MAATAAFATRHGLRLTVQCSGHGAGADLSDTIMVRTSALREIIVDPARNLVKVGAGVRGRDLAAALPPHGLAASLGSGPTTGVTGFTMFGGLGVLGRAVGFMAHKMVAADVVTADGTRLRCDADAHPDLLWALRGGGGGYALVTDLELQLDRAPDLFGGQIVWPAAAAPEVLGAWRDWTAELPPEMSSSVGVISLPPLPEVPEPLRGTRVTTVTACYAGPADRGAATLGQLTAQTSTPMVNAGRPLTAADLGNLWNVPSTPTPSRIRGELLSGLPDRALGELTRLAGQDPESPIMMAEVRHLGGMLAQDPPDARRDRLLRGTLPARVARPGRDPGDRRSSPTRPTGPLRRPRAVDHRDDPSRLCRTAARHRRPRLPARHQGPATPSQRPLRPQRRHPLQLDDMSGIAVRRVAAGWMRGARKGGGCGSVAGDRGTGASGV